MVEKKIISNFESRNEFLKLLELNPGLVIVKLGAEWCVPCQRIKQLLESFFKNEKKTNGIIYTEL